MSERIEFIEEKKERKELKKTSFRELLDGSLLTSEYVTGQLPYIVFVTMLVIFYIGNRYHAEQVLRETMELQEEVRELRAEAIFATAQLMDMSKQTEVLKLIDKHGLQLKELVEPPKKIRVPKNFK